MHPCENWAAMGLFAVVALALNSFYLRYSLPLVEDTEVLFGAALNGQFEFFKEYAGYIAIPPRVFCLICQVLPVMLIPKAYVFIATMCNALCAMSFYLQMAHWMRCSRRSAVAFSLLYLFMSSGCITSYNLMYCIWPLSLAAINLSLILPQLKGWRWWALAALIVFAGISSNPLCVILPAGAAVYAVMECARANWKNAARYAFFAVIQIVVLLAIIESPPVTVLTYTDVVKRAVDAMYLILARVISPVSGAIHPLDLQFVFLTSGFALGFLFVMLSKDRSRHIQYYIFAAIICVFTFLLCLTNRYNIYYPEMMHDAARGNRYVYIQFFLFLELLWIAILLIRKSLPRYAVLALFVAHLCGPILYYPALVQTYGELDYNGGDDWIDRSNRYNDVLESYVRRINQNGEASEFYLSGYWRDRVYKLVKKD
ncbi:hypothetical protein JXA32_05695 [Candidatus Sumerlaeota bacterium]|nr:hypothetical protein [Candidatus Sumerlaeota bacterium]